MVKTQRKFDFLVFASVRELFVTTRHLGIHWKSVSEYAQAARNEQIHANVEVNLFK